jgi:hypothetical protein
MTRIPASVLGGLVFVVCSAALVRADERWSAFAETGTIEILTVDADGDLRETPVWIVVLDDTAYVRTNDSRWLANIRRGSTVTLRSGDVELAVQAEESEEPEEFDRVEEAFKTKYGWMQRIMSTFRMSRPTLLRLTPKPVD